SSTASPKRGTSACTSPSARRSRRRGDGKTRMLQRRMAPARKYLRRALQAVALAGTLLVGMAAHALIISQTPWFRARLLKYVVGEAGNYVNGTLSIGSLGGNLFYGVELDDVAIEVNGERVVSLKQVEIKYSVSELTSQGMIVRQIV